MTTPLSSDGSFWVQLLSVEQPEFHGMVEALQLRCGGEEPPTPVFFSPGDVCAAQFSEDGCWYRACVEESVRNKVRREPWGEGGGGGPAYRVTWSCDCYMTFSPFFTVCGSVFGLWQQRGQGERVPSGAEVRVQGNPLPGLPVFHCMQ